ncbi:FHA domain-containing protein [Kribbella sp. NPDC051587]|uniref:FHA domain-containing protein n=1 Tax=Kribbella sp. NPDC051587 TaxID=3364119 RepID=UPI0037B8F16E
METEFALSLGTQRWPLPAPAEEITLGRAANADVRLPADDQISRIHARLTRTGATWTLHDASRNGTGLNGRRLTESTPLTDGDQIHIGRSVLTFHATPAAPGGPPAATPSSSVGTTPPASAPASSTAATPPNSAGTPPPAGSPAATPPSSGGTPPATSAPAAPPPAAPAQSTPPAAPPVPSAPAAASPAPDAGVPPTPSAPASTPPSTTPPSPAEAAPSAPPPNTAPSAAPPTAAPAAPGQDDGPGSEGEWRGTASSPEDSGLLTPASTTPPPPAPPRTLTPRPAPTNQQPPNPPSRTPADSRPGDGAPADSPFAPTEGTRRNEPYPADRASVSQPNPADANNSASWPGYPSADYLESARSPWSNGERAQIVQPDTPPHPAWPDRADYPEPDDPTPTRPTRPASRPAKRPERRTSETPSIAEAGQVRLARVLAIAGAMLAVGLVINMIATFLADGPGGMLRWLIAPTVALLGAMTFAVLDAVSPTERAASRLDVSVIVAIGAVLLGVGVGGFAITAGAEYVAGYLSGNENGEDQLIKPVGKTVENLTITVDNVTNTSHFTRIRITVTNKGADAVSLPLDGNATFTSAEGNSIRADNSRSDWPEQFAAGQVEKGTIIFKGHLPQGLKTATLMLRGGDTPIILGGVPLSN